MFVVRFVVLAFLVAYSWSMGQIPSNELNEFGVFVSFLFFIVAPAMYLLPTYEAWTRDHPNLGAIAAVNVFLGWSLVGWVIALVWAFKRPEPVVQISQTPPSSPASSVQQTRRCPFCAEEILAAAVKCKHCGSFIEGSAPESEIVTAQTIPESNASDSDLMEKYGISFQNGVYNFGGYRYEKLSDAVNYAKRQVSG